MEDNNSMFEPPAANAEQDRSRLILALSGVAVLVVLAAIIVVSSKSSSKPSAEATMPQAGSAEFDSYASFVKINNLDKWTSSTLIGRRLAILRAVVQNTGDRTIIGLKLRGTVVGLGGETLSQRISTQIPRVRQSLAPGETMQVTVQIDPIPDPGEMSDMTLDVYALKLK
jgi:hypothetical protein